MNRTHILSGLILSSLLSGHAFADAGARPPTAASPGEANEKVERLFLVSRPARRDVSKITLINAVTEVKVEGSKIVSYVIASDKGPQTIKTDTLDATHTEVVDSSKLVENLKAKSADHFIDIDKASVDVLVKSEKGYTSRSDKFALGGLKAFLEHRPNYARTGLARYGNLNEAGLYGKIDRSAKPPVDPRSLPVTADHYGSNVTDPKKHPNMTREEMGGTATPVRDAVKSGVDDAVRE